MSITNKTSLVRRLQQHALPDPHDEREVLHASLLIEAAERIQSLEAELSEYKKKIEKSHS